MAAFSHSDLTLVLPLAAGVGSGLAILVLCVVAGIGTVLLLPGKRERSFRSIGGALVLMAGLIGMALIAKIAANYTSGDAYFWIFSFIAVVCSIRVITHPKPVYSALYFVLTVLATSGLFVLLWAEFMAAALVLIYAGAILITYVFVIMLAAQAHTGVTGEIGGADYDETSREPMKGAVVGFAVMGVLLFVIFDKMQGMNPIEVAAAEQPAMPIGTEETTPATEAFVVTPDVPKHEHVIEITLTPPATKPSTQKAQEHGPATVPATAPATQPATVPTTRAATQSTTAPTSGPATLPATQAAASTQPVLLADVPVTQKFPNLVEVPATLPATSPATQAATQHVIATTSPSTAPATIAVVTTQPTTNAAVAVVSPKKSVVSQPAEGDDANGTVRGIGAYLFSKQVINLEVAGLILTLAMVGAIVIASKRVHSEVPVVHEELTGPATPVNDDPHSIPVYGTDNPAAKAFPEN